MGDYWAKVKRFEENFYRLTHTYEHLYRVFKTHWGIRIQIFAEYTSMSGYSKKESCIQICPGLWAVYSSDLSRDICFILTKNEKQLMWEGLRKTKEPIQSYTPYKQDTLIIVHYIYFNECDYQEEGLTPAMMGWAAKAFNFETPLIHTCFNKESNRYQFSFGDTSGSDAAD